MTFTVDNGLNPYGAAGATGFYINMQNNAFVDRDMSNSFSMTWAAPITGTITSFGITATTTTVQSTTAFVISM